METSDYERANKAMRHAKKEKGSESKRTLRSTDDIRKEKIESQFSTWDGSHRNLEKYIKENMNDPDSYEHVET